MDVFTLLCRVLRRTSSDDGTRLFGVAVVRVGSYQMGCALQSAAFRASDAVDSFSVSVALAPGILVVELGERL